MRRGPTRALGLTIAGLTAGALALAAGCDGGGDDDGQAGCTSESCLDQCLAAFAAELEDCGGICGVESLCLASGECDCTFYPCHEQTCQEWCVASEGLEHGGCGAVSGNILACDCW